MIQSVASPTEYRRQRDSGRLSEHGYDQAISIQRLGWTMSEIAVSLGERVEVVKRSLYWDLRK